MTDFQWVAESVPLPGFVIRATVVLVRDDVAGPATGPDPESAGAGDPESAGAGDPESAGARDAGSGGGWILLESEGRRLHRPTIRPAGAGLEHRWNVGGGIRPFDEPARQWRDGMLTVLRGLMEINRIHREKSVLEDRISRRPATHDGGLAGRRSQVAYHQSVVADLLDEISYHQEVLSGMRGEIVMHRARVAAFQEVKATHEAEYHITSRHTRLGGGCLRRQGRAGADAKGTEVSCDVPNAGILYGDTRKGRKAPEATGPKGRRAMRDARCGKQRIHPPAAALPAAVLAVVAAVTATGCVTAENSPVAYSAAELEAFMGTREERAARAPYSPSGWPLKIGDNISGRRWDEITARFPHFGSDFDNVFWLGDMAFGAAWGTNWEWHRANPWKISGFDDPVYRYNGHFRAYGLCAHLELPSHVRDPSKACFEWMSEKELKKKKLYSGIDYYTTEGRPQDVWTRERWLAGYTGDGR